jgi:hypothetical protein
MIHELPECRNVPVIFLTGLLTPAQDNKESPKIQVDGKLYPAFAKPFKAELLLRAVEEIIQARGF